MEQLIKRHLGVNTPDWVVEKVKGIVREQISAQFDPVEMQKTVQRTLDEVMRYPRQLFSSGGVEAINRERTEQVIKHGYDESHDDQYRNKELANFAAWILTREEQYWPATWKESLKDKVRQKTYRESLVVAASVLAAEIDRIDRATTDMEFMSRKSGVTL